MLKVTVDLLQEQLEKVKEEKETYQEHAAQYMVVKRREKELEDQLEKEILAKNALANEHKIILSQFHSSQGLIEFYKTQFEDWKKVYQDQKENWKKEVNFAAESLRSKVLELELEKEHMMKQMSKMQQEKHSMQDYAETQFIQTVKKYVILCFWLLSRHSGSQPVYTDIFSIIRENQKKRESQTMNLMSTRLSAEGTMKSGMSPLSSKLY